MSGVVAMLLSYLGPKLAMQIILPLLLKAGISSPAAQKMAAGATELLKTALGKASGGIPLTDDEKEAVRRHKSDVMFDPRAFR